MYTNTFTEALTHTHSITQKSIVHTQTNMNARKAGKRARTQVHKHRETPTC